MEIYQEPSSPAGGGGNPVSFGTPITRSGRKPLTARNHPQQSSTSKDNIIRPRGTPHAKAKGGMDIGMGITGTETTNRDDKENQGTMGFLSPSVVPSPTPAAATTGSAQSFRRALRGKSPKQSSPTIGETAAIAIASKFVSGETKRVRSVVPEAATKVVSFAASQSNETDDGVTIARVTVPGGRGLLSKRTTLGATGRDGRLGGGALGPPQRVVPKTPNSLLRTELDGDDDDSLNAMDESLLVSPPGALWNVLGASHIPSSANSTGVYIVPPHTAAAIHEISTSQKKKQQSDRWMDWASPPMQPRSLLQTTPEGDEEEIDEHVTTKENESDATREEEVITESLESPEATTAQARKGVAMDLSKMFSVEKSPAKVSTANAKPPSHLLQRLQKPTVRSKAAGEKKDAQPKRIPPKRAGPKPSSSLLNTKEEILPVEVEPISRGTGLTMDMSNLFSSNSSALAQLTPPPQLLERLQKTKASSSKGTSKGEVFKNRPGITKPLPADTKPKHELSTVVIDPISKGNNGICESAAKPQAAPLLKRQEHRTAPKSMKNTIAEKENGGTKPTSKGVTHTKAKVPPVKNINSNVSIPSTFKTGPTNRPSVAIADVIPARLPLQKNSKFFLNSQENQVETKPEVEATGERPASCHQSIAFEISAPTENTGTQKTPTKQKTIKTKSPIKIAWEADDWAGKQCDTFVSWLNYTFHPDEEEGDSASGRNGLRALVIHRRLAQVRYRAADLFQSDAMKGIRDTVQSEIAKGRLAIRSDQDLYADLSLRKQTTQLLLSYTTPWLRLGLEVMFGERIMPDNIQDRGDGEMVSVAEIVVFWHFIDFS